MQALRLEQQLKASDKPRFPEPDLVVIFFDPPISMVEKDSSYATHLGLKERDDRRSQTRRIQEHFRSEPHFLCDASHDLANTGGTFWKRCSRWQALEKADAKMRKPAPMAVWST
ncbi:MAG: hypothetical protein HC897_00585 [Thermoanaerobaculia bacterium]|nr:hypothetical protein [Thermoanaerobaculia bacterium]